MLAARAIERAPAGLNDPADRPAASLARLPLPVIHAQRYGEVPDVAFGVQEIAHCRTARRDRLVQDLPQADDEPVPARPCDPSDRPSRAEPGPVERLARVDVPHT